MTIVEIAAHTPSDLSINNNRPVDCRRIGKYLMPMHQERFSVGWILGDEGRHRWAGLRGGLSLAAAFALPLTIASGALFPERERIIFLTFCVIAATLIVQGVGLVPLIRVLGLRSDPTPGQELQYARQIAIRAALDRLGAQATDDGVPEPFVADLRGHYQEKLRRVTRQLDGNALDDDPTPARQRLHRAVIAAERTAVIQLRGQGRIADDVLRTIERELDLEDQRVSH
jgi:hypothetical protein